MPEPIHHVLDEPAPPESEIELTILMPCLNEALTLGICIEKALRFIGHNGIKGEVLIADNGSTDGSQDIARAHGARVVLVPERGYGAALIGGIKAARGRFVIMGDADDSYDFLALDPFVGELRAGADLVMGNRFRGKIEPGAMPKLHRYLGNPVLTGVGRLFFHRAIGDFHCGLRGFRREAMLGIGLNAPGMEFASEMVAKAALHGLRIAEVPTHLKKDGRDRPPHLRSWRDGWRHLRFMLMFSPNWLFIYPGSLLLLFGTAGLIALQGGALRIGAVTFDINTMLYAGEAAGLGSQILTFGLFAKL
jgi:glycosyltransferase involved in cell wall biosynthesis